MMKNGAPWDEKFTPEEGLITNANPHHDSLNGMGFEKTMIDQYYARKCEQRYAEQQMAKGEGGDYGIAGTMSDYFQDALVENSRYMYYPVAKPSK